MSESDTFAALATPPGEGALAVIRISGPDTCLALDALGFERAAPPPPRSFQRAHYRDLKGAVVDDLTFVFFQGPRSYTGEDMIELTAHGSPFIVEKILQDLQARGIGLAEPGAFTRAAFLNGKLDLAQAEAVVDLIRARSDRALQVAQQQLSGTLGKKVEELVSQLLRVTAGLEAYIDFPEEDLPPENQEGPRNDLRRLAEALHNLAATQKYRDRLQDGVRVVLLGEPNAGKSTLLNALVGEERAIVSEEAGTTRDYIEVRVVLGSHLVRLIDTAGLRESVSKVERAGVERSKQLARDADIILLVLDRSTPPPSLDPAIAEALRKKPAVVVLNKADLDSHEGATAFLADLPRCLVAAQSGSGLDALRGTLIGLLNSDYAVPESADVIVSARHAGALDEARTHVECALRNLVEAEPPELAASDLHLAIEAMERIVGKIDNERMLDELFGSFCIGK